MTRSNSANLNALFSQAAERGIISPGTLHTLSAVDLGARIKNALGISADQVEASEVFLVTLLLDDSGSIREAGQEDTVRQGHNRVVEVLRRKGGDHILFHAATLNRAVVYPFRLGSEVPELDGSNYQATGGTPLYDQTIAVLGTVLAKEREFAVQEGVPCHTATLIMTDGEDLHSLRSVQEVARLVADMRARETHIIAALGVDNHRTDFRAVFGAMGIDPKFMLLPGSSDEEILRCFGEFSQSAVQASQGAGAFSRVLGGGFANP